MTQPDPEMLAGLETLDLIKLHKWDTERMVDGKKSKLGKAPVGRWRTENCRGTPEDWMLDGHNVGVRLAADQLVIDVDPRNFPVADNPLDDLAPDEYLSLFRNQFSVGACPTVRTGGGGWHLYFSMPVGAKLVNELKEWPGIEFKSIGRQVVAPGSVHPDTEDHYVVEHGGFDCLPHVSQELIAAVGKGSKSSKTNKSVAGEISSAKLAELLSHLNPEDYHNYEEWLQIMMACHHATAGSGCEEFVEWSTSDPAYSDAGEAIVERWGTLKQDGGVTVATLMRAVRKSRGNTPPDKNWPLIASAYADHCDGRILRDARNWLTYVPAVNRYEPIDDERFGARVHQYLNDLTVVNGKGDCLPMIPNRTSLAETLAALNARSQAPAELPCWLEGSGPKPGDLLAVRNGLLNLATDELLPKTDRFATRNAAQVNYDPSAECPRWRTFIREIFSDDGNGEVYDEDAASVLQEVMGLLLTHDTSLQKIFLMVSRPRGGKGTVIRTLTRLIGEGSITSPSSKDLAGAHGLSGLVGKQVAVMTDLRMAGKQSIIEDMLRISGEDMVTINPKNEKPIDVRLPTRFLLATNTLPQFRDASGAIVTRLVLIKTRASFLGREDHGLEETLTSELPGILNWCLEGLSRVRQRGSILPPKSSRPDVEAMTRVASPVSGFVEECLELAPGHEEVKSVVYNRFEDYCAEIGINYGGGENWFPTDLRAIVPTLDEKRARLANGSRPYVYVGVKLK